MKKWVIGIMVILMAVTMAACGNSATPETPLSSTGDVGGSGDGLLYVGYAQVGHESDWRMANSESFKQTFTEANGYKLDFVDCDQKTEMQISTIRDFIQKGVDYIVLAPNTEAGWETVLGEAKDAGIPVILSDREIDTTDDSLFVAWVGGNFLQEGYNAVEALEKCLVKKGMADQEINIVLLQGTMGSSAQIGRTAGFEEKLPEHANWNLLDKQSGDFNQEKGQEVMEALLKSHDNINVVIAENDNMAFGAVTAIKAAGKTCGPDGDITIISYDAVKAAFEAMIAGDIDVDVECNPLHGPRVDDIIKALEAGQSVDKKMYVDEAIFYAEDAAEILPSRAY